ncbi:MAG: serine acetyltransferase [Proteobacteria bacterium]|nr:serine acetyltransferase [Pseudomonadota bacterium]
MNDLTRALCESMAALAPSRAGEWRPLPASDTVARVTETLRRVLFPGYFDTAELQGEQAFFQTGIALHEAIADLETLTSRALCFTSAGHTRDCDVCPRRAREIVERFVGQLAALQQRLIGDVRAAYDGDPAATGPEETILSYPGVRAVTLQRIAHALHVLGVPLVPRMITEHAHALTGIDIHPGAAIGDRFFIDHGTGVVIGETAVIGRNVRLYQGVTLGARSFPLDAEGRPVKGRARHPIIEDDVVIYAGATVLGRITVGRGSIIGGNVWLTESVPAGSVVTQSALRHETYGEGAGI